MAEPDIPGMVKAIRQSLELTQEQLARELGVTFSTVNAWENGRHRPIPVLLAALRRLAAEQLPGRKTSTPLSTGGGGLT
jgi:DNA-binding transcriptional regulator YiaG